MTRETLERTVTQALPEPGANEWTFVGPSIYDGTFGPWDIVAMPDNRVALAGKRGGRRVQFVLDQAGALAWNNYWQDGEENCVAFDGQDLLYVGEHPDLGEVAHVSTEGEQLELLHVPDVNGNWKTLYGCATHEGALYLAGNYQHYMYLYAGTTPLATFDVGDDFCCSLEYGLALDAHGRITVAGGGRLSMGSQSRRFVAQFDLDGQPRWQDIATPPGSDSIVFRGLSVGPEDDIYVIYGPHAVIREPQTLTLYRYSSDGELLWKYDTNSEMFEDVAVDERGTVYLAAIARVSENRDSFRIYALGPDDELQWMREHKAPMGADISSMHIALGANGELWVAGELWSGGDMWVGRFGI
ncbi:MAG: hypothetical protein R3A51_05940 [Nannocystaceae bacterium]